MIRRTARTHLLGTVREMISVPSHASDERILCPLVGICRGTSASCGTIEYRSSNGGLLDKTPTRHGPKHDKWDVLKPSRPCERLTRNLRYTVAQRGRFLRLSRFLGCSYLTQQRDVCSPRHIINNVIARQSESYLRVKWRSYDKYERNFFLINLFSYFFYFFFDNDINTNVLWFNQSRAIIWFTHD